MSIQLTLGIVSRCLSLLMLPLWVGRSAWAQTSDPPELPTTDVPDRPNTSASTDNPQAAAKRRRFPRLGLNTGIYLPEQDRVQSRFQNRWFSIGPGIGDLEQVKQRGRFAPDLYLLSSSHDRNHAYIANIGVGYRVALADSSTKLCPFIGATTDLCPTYISVPKDDVRYGLRMSYSGSAIAGLNVGRSGILEARYRLSTGVRGLNFSGLGMQAGVRF